MYVTVPFPLFLCLQEYIRLPFLLQMCFAVKCDKCSKTTWSGCGAHIETVKASVPADQWCTCPR
jgi:hypothetical protein